MRVSDNRYQLLGDQPYTWEGDPFGFDTIARELHQLILRSRRSSPFTIGVEASWGRGKSSLMGQLKRLLEPVDGSDDPVVQPDDNSIPVEIRTVAYNAWTAEGSDVLEGLIKSVLNAMDRNVLRRALRNEQLVSMLRVLVLLVAGWLRVGSMVDEVWNRVSVDARTRNQINDLVRKAMEDWERQAKASTGDIGPDKLLVVFIDDLDRCSPATVLKVFEALKLYLDAPGFVFVIGYDDNIVSEAILEQKQFSKQVTGRDYVEKIVQIVFRIPRPSDDQMNELLRRYLDESATGELFEQAERQLLIDRNDRNPRRIKRFVNRFILDYRLDDTSADLEEELLIKLLILEIYFPEFARLFDNAEPDKNPIQEFIDYVDACNSLRQTGTVDPHVERVLAAYGENSAGTPEEVLARLDRIVDEQYVSLRTDQSFLTLVRSIEQPDQDRLLRKVQRRAELGVRPVSELGDLSSVADETIPRAEIAPFTGKRILWIDDHPKNNARVAETLNAGGATIQEATSGEEAMTVLSWFEPDLVISDVGRGGLREAGFRDLERIQREGLYAGPVVFYTDRVSASTREKARQLGAFITSNEAELLKLVDSSLAQRVQRIEQTPDAVA